MKYKAGDRVRIKKERTELMARDGYMDKYLGTIMTITLCGSLGYDMLEDGSVYSWYDEMIEGLADEWTPKEGEIVLVKDNCDETFVEKAKFLFKDKRGFIICVAGSTDSEYEKGNHYSVFCWDEMKKIDEKKERKIMMTDQEWDEFQKNNNIN